MSDRFTRDYILTIGIGAQKVVIRPPFNLSFSATENVDNRALNKLQAKIPGLKESTRLKLIKYELDKSIYLPIELIAGYEGNIHRVFKGSVQTGTLSREGATFSSTLDCQDGHPDFNESYTSRTVKGRSLSIDAIIEDMPNTQKGAVTELTATTRPKVLVGASSDLLSQIAEGRQMYIKDEKVYILNDNEVPSMIAPIVSAKTGLKGTPVQDHIETTFTTMLNPALKIGHLCELISVTNPAVNGLYKIWQITTNGSYKGVWEQTITCRKQNNYVVVR